MKNITINLPFLLAALITVPAYAAPLNPDDWKTIAPEGCFTFNNDGTLTATGNASGNELHYIIREDAIGTNLMQNGSGMSVTLQFNPESFLNDAETEIYIAFHNNNSEINGKDFLEVFFIRNTGNQLNIYNKSSSFDEYHDLDTGENPTEIEVDFIIENNILCCSYSLNGIASRQFITEAVDTGLDWKPSFGLAYTDTNVFTVTDVSFNSIPEPATASFFLSLLTFIGLTARRRRK